MTHAVDGAREAIYSAPIFAAVAKIWMALPVLGPVEDTGNLMILSGIAGGITAVVKAGRNWLRKNKGWNFGGTV